MIDPTVAWVIAGVASISCVACWVMSVRNKRDADELWTVDLYGTTELKRMCSDGFNATVQVEGTVSCDSPIVSIAAQRSCCYFTTQVEREDRQVRTVESTDSEGRKTSSQEETLTWQTEYSQSHFVPFRVIDQQGFCLVQPEGSQIDLVNVYSSTSNGRLEWFDDLGVGWSNTNRYRVTENAFLPDGYAFVHGRAYAQNDCINIAYPDTGYVNAKRKVFVISRKNKQGLLAAKQKTAAYSFWGALVLGMIALFAVLCATGVILI